MGSRCSHEQLTEFGNLLPVLYPIGQCAQGKSFDFSPGLISRGAIGHHAWEKRNLGDPAAIVLPLKLDPQHVA